MTTEVITASKTANRTRVINIRTDDIRAVATSRYGRRPLLLALAIWPLSNFTHCSQSLHNQTRDRILWNGNDELKRILFNATRLRLSTHTLRYTYVNLVCGMWQLANVYTTERVVPDITNCQRIYYIPLIAPNHHSKSQR